MNKLRLLDIFSGLGGFSLGLERSGYFQTVAFCEIEPFPRRVLKKHWPDVPIYEDVRTLTADSLRYDGIAIDAICGGFPCQDLSRAGSVWGKREGLNGSRSGLWSEYARLIGELRPKYVVVENVPEVTVWLPVILSDLAACGHDAEWDCLHTTVVGGRCPRERFWLVSYPSVQRLDGEHRQGEPEGDFGRIFNAIARTLSQATQRQDWVSEPAIPRVVDGSPGRLDRINRTKAIGNAVVPQIPELIGRAIGEVMERSR